MRIGITGHRRLQNPLDWEWVRLELNDLLANSTTPLVGVTSLAIGADQLFATSVLQKEGTIEAVIPYPEYETSFEEEDKAAYRDLIARASKVRILPNKASVEEAYLEAGKAVVDSSDLMVVVWDGKPAKGLGGTGDAVEYARQKGKKIIHLNPDLHAVIELYK